MVALCPSRSWTSFEEPMVLETAMATMMRTAPAWAT